MIPLPVMTTQRWTPMSEYRPFAGHTVASTHMRASWTTCVVAMAPNTGLKADAFAIRSRRLGSHST